MAQPDRFTISCPTQIIFGAGTAADLGKVLPRGCRSVAFVTGKSGIAAASVQEDLHRSGLSVTHVSCGAEPSVPAINEALEKLVGARTDAVIACGGGSVIDTGKLLAFLLSNDLSLPDEFDRIDAAHLAQPGSIPCIALPTTAGTGAEVTANAVVYVPSKGAKISLRGRAIAPATAIVDPDLMRAAPVGVVLHAGLDAVTQVIEAYTSAAATPFSDGLSRPAIRKGLAALKAVIARGDAASWRDMAWVSLASGLALANGGLGAAHGLAGVLGGRYGAPHGALCGRLLLPVMRQNLIRSAAGSDAHNRHIDCSKAIADVFPPTDKSDPLSGFEDWMAQNALPRLSHWGLCAEDFNAVAGDAVNASSSKKNAVPLSREDLVMILQDAL
jgi:alcohol dehydrogenase class IV